MVQCTAPCTTSRIQCVSCVTVPIWTQELCLNIPDWYKQSLAEQVSFHTAPDSYLYILFHVSFLFCIAVIFWRVTAGKLILGTFYVAASLSWRRFWACSLSHWKLELNGAIFNVITKMSPCLIHDNHGVRHRCSIVVLSHCLTHIGQFKIYQRLMQQK